MTTAEQRSDEDAIRELLDRQVMGWVAGDADAYASVSQHKGRAAIAASYARLFKKFLKGSRLDFEITQLRFLTPDVALVHAKGAVSKRGGRRHRRNTRVNTTIAVLTDGRWLFAASQNTTHRRLAEKLMGKLA